MSFCKTSVRTGNHTALSLAYSIAFHIYTTKHYINSLLITPIHLSHHFPVGVAHAAPFTSSSHKQIQRARIAHKPRTICMATTLEFIKGIEESTIPDVKLTRSRDGSSGTATFVFDSPSIFEASSELGDITGLYMTDDEGTITTVDVQAKFINGKPSKIEAKYVMRSTFEWERFMRWMERYAEEKGLGFAQGA